jgi:bifunctional DNA-binding transcriptional regulator/antitoxin component of YhaV-PrlF toxin-antitoxin module
MSHSNLAHSVKGLPTTAAKIRALAGQGYARADIARALGIRYQQVRNVLVRAEVKAAAVAQVGEATGSPNSESKRAKIRVGSDRQVVLPLALSDALGLKAGDALFARVSEGEILLLTREAVTRRVQALAREFVPEGVSLVDELLEDRRREVEAESQHG